MTPKPEPSPEIPDPERAGHALPLSEHNAIGVFPSMDAARAAVDALERAGVEAANISLLGPAIEKAAAHTDTTERDAGTLERVGKRAVAGGVAGSTAGGAVGFLAGLAAFALPGVGPLIGAGVWAAAIGGAIAGGTVGGMVGGFSGVGMTEAYELTFDTVKRGRVLVGVHSAAAETVERGAGILESAGPVSLHRFDRSGTRIVATDPPG